jgi:hypothetical protein
MKDRAYTREEIAKMLEKAGKRERLVILLMCSSGMRVGALPFLKIRNLERLNKFSLYKLTIYENEDDEYITHSAPRNVQRPSIRIWISDRDMVSESKKMLPLLETSLT